MAEVRDTATPVARFERRTFDETERERIRHALRRYKDEQKISMSRFAHRIAEANGRKRGMISRRTLERFINERFNSDDDFVNYCDVFLRMGEPPPPYEIMGDAIVAFFDRAPRAPEPRKQHGAKIHAMFARRYRCYLRGERTALASDKPFDDPNWPVPEGSELEPAYEIPYAVLELEPLIGTAYIKVSEHVVNPMRSPYWGRATAIGVKLSAASENHNYVGALALCAAPQLYVITLRQRAFQFPKFYLLFDTDPHTVNAQSAILGSCLGVSDDPNGLTPAEAFDIKLIPVPEE